ncbi:MULTISPECIES: DUF1801 domain-containing protein [unclassified Roseateles]|uniref:DUF1801 domain-containing protein n=1 Tax=unclassified Roseateles TaxID=2626991 RepID=UPI0006FD4E26|nr:MULTISPECIES: DUF1801 domain-containing protein [unclassified Roseateles]KQW45465.1 hypothetical protein ASC81_11160 [Pelomonas sp. Root405]KRA72309.1 hypothetical protein ASD88_11160 [Pelomonas sp. Root662]
MATASKTVPTDADVEAFFAAQPEARAADCRALAALMQRVSGHPPRMWGKMVGFGDHHYVYESGREGDIFEIGFASGAGGKGDISLYLTCDAGAHAALLTRLGKHRAGKGCIYIKRMADVDAGVLAELCEAALQEVRR